MSCSAVTFLLAILAGQGVEDALRRFRAADWEAYDELVFVGEPVVPQLSEILADPEAGNARWMAAKALGQIGSAECALVLLGALDDPWFQVRRLAAEGLGFIGDPGLRTALEELAANDPYLYLHPDTGERMYLVRDAARKALSRLLEEEVFLQDASRCPAFEQPPGERVKWPFPGRFKEQKLWNNYQQPTDDYVHAALDLIQEAGTEVRAVESGTVALIATNYPEWKTHHFFVVEPVAESGEGWCYTHVDPETYAFEVGDLVEQGQILGRVVDFSLGERDGSDHLHLNYVSFERGDKVNLQSLYDPLVRFSFEDDRPPTIHTPFWLVEEGSLDPVDAERPVSGKLDVLVAISDNAYRDQACNWMVPAVTIEIKRKGHSSWRKLVLDQRGPIPSERTVRPLYLSHEERQPFVSKLPPWPRPYVLKATNTDGDGIIELADERQCWDTTSLDDNGKRRFPDGRYTIVVRAWDLAGNRAEASMRVVVKNPDSRR